MENVKKVTVRVGPGGLTLLLLLFVALKLTGQVGWSWWWVLSPVWAGPAFIAVLFIAIVAAAGLVSLWKQVMR